MDKQLGTLYAKYARAIRALENALVDRQRRRPKPGAAPPPRRPVGAPPSAVVRASLQPTARATTAPTMRIYLGPALGWARVVGNWDAYREPSDPTAWFRAAAMYDDIAAQLLQRTMNDYLAARRAFFDYVRRAGVETHNATAKALLDSAAMDQMFGWDESSGAKIEQAKAEVSAALEQEYKLYETSSKREEHVVRLLGAVAATQMVGAEESATYRSSIAEISRVLELPDAGAVPTEATLRARRAEIRQRAGRAVDAYKAEPEPKSLNAKMALVDALSEVRIVLPETDPLRRNLEAHIARILSGRDAHLQR